MSYLMTNPPWAIRQDHSGRDGTAILSLSSSSSGERKKKEREEGKILRNKTDSAP
jgi:hypothetical protein